MHPAHRLLGLTVGLTVTAVVPLPAWQTVGVVALAGVMSNGKTSPDIDGARGWRDVIPGPHRGPLHCPEVVAVGVGLFYLAAFAAEAAVPLVAAVGVTWVPLGLACGWGSHLLGDFLFGQLGLPTVLFGDVGLRFDVDGPAEWYVALPLLGAAVVVLVGWHLGVDLTVVWQGREWSTTALR